MRFKIEYLTDITREESVCHYRFSLAGDVPNAEIEAMALEAIVRKNYDAKGFQVRDLSEAGRVVSLEAF